MGHNGQAVETGTIYSASGLTALEQLNELFPSTTVKSTNTAGNQDYELGDDWQRKVGNGDGRVGELWR